MKQVIQNVLEQYVEAGCSSENYTGTVAYLDIWRYGFKFEHSRISIDNEIHKFIFPLSLSTFWKLQLALVARQLINLNVTGIVYTASRREASSQATINNLLNVYIDKLNISHIC